MQGFFHKREIEGAPAGRKVSGCLICRLHRTCISPKMPHTGKGKLKILAIAEAPGAEEDKQNIQLIGKAGQTFRHVLRSLDLDLDRDFWKTNALICRPPDNATPTETQLEACRPNLLRTIEELKPRQIWLLGSSALNTFLAGQVSEVGGIMRWRGAHIPDRRFHAWVCPMLHPAYLNYEKNSEVVKVIFKRDIQRALKILDEPFPKWKEEKECVEILTNPALTRLFLTRLSETCPTIAIDFETTGKKPQATGHRIVTVGIAFDQNHSVAFPFSEGLRKPLKKILQNRAIPKIGQNIKFEQIWSREFLGGPILGWKWDTMVAARVLHNERGTSGLDFQAYSILGTPDYSSEIDPFLKSKDQKDGNSFNRIGEVDRRDLLTYNAIDSLVTYRIAMVQMGRKEFAK